MGVGIWFEMLRPRSQGVPFPKLRPDRLALKANVATAVVKQLSNLKLDVLLENRDALSRNVREEVSPPRRSGASVWLNLHPQGRVPRQGHDRRNPAQGRQPPAPGHRRHAAGRRERSRDHPLRSRQESLTAPRTGPGRATSIVGHALAEIQRDPEVATALFALLDIQATLKSPGKITLNSGEATGLLLNS